MTSTETQTTADLNNAQLPISGISEVVQEPNNTTVLVATSIVSKSKTAISATTPHVASQTTAALLLTPSSADSIPDDDSNIIRSIIMDDEGGFVLSHDPDGGDGGATYAGVTLTTWNAYTKIHNVGVFPPSNSQVMLLYYNDFFLPAFINNIATDPTLKLALFSCVINMGMSRYVKTIQKLYPKLVDDGQMGKGTLAAITAQPITTKQFVFNWQLEYVDIIINDSVKTEFMAGWLRRTQRYL